MKRPSEKPMIRFEENKNQWDTRALYKADIKGGALFLEKNTFTYVYYNPEDMEHHCSREESLNTPSCSSADKVVRGHAFKMRFLNSNPGVVVSGTDKLRGYYNYFIGDDPSRWVSFVGLFAGISYEGLYPGIDLHIYGKDTDLKYEYHVKPGSSPGFIRTEYEGTDGLQLTGSSLVIHTSVTKVTESEPFAYQNIGGKLVQVACRYVLKGTTVSFLFPDGYDLRYPLIIDPFVVAATYVGSHVHDTWGHSATYDDEGNIYTGGRSFGSGYPTTTGVFQHNYGGGGTDIAISKFNPDGSVLLWASYLGGNGEEYAQSLIVNSNQELFVYGATASGNFPTTTGCYDATQNGGFDIFITHFDANGSGLIGSTFIGGSSDDGHNNIYHIYGDYYRGEIILDNNSNPLVASFSQSSNFPTTAGVFDQTYNGGQDGVVLKFNSDLTSLIWSTFLGGSGDDAGYGLKINIVDYVYVVGGTSSSNFPTTPWALHSAYQGGNDDGFMCILAPDASYQMASTYFGTPQFDEVFFVELDATFNVYLYGITEGIITPTAGVFSNPGSGQFIVKLDQTLTSVMFSTVFGNGTSSDGFSPTAFMVDDCEKIYAAGWGYNTSGFPVSTNAVQSTTDGEDFYLLVLSKDALSLEYATFYGASSNWEHVDGGTSRFDKKGIVYEAVCEGSAFFPCTANAYCSTNFVGWDLAVFKIDFQTAPPEAICAAVPDTIGCAPFTVNFSNNSLNAVTYFWNFGDGSPSSTQMTPAHTYANPGVYQVIFRAIDSANCHVFDEAQLTIRVLPVPEKNLGNDTLLCNGGSLLLDAGNPGCTYHWSTNDTTQTLTVSAPGTYWVQVHNEACVSTDTIVIDYMQPPSLGSDTSLCTGDSLVLSTGIAGDHYLWSNGDTTYSTTVHTSAAYWVEVTRQYCTRSDTIQVAFFPLPSVNLGNDTALCAGRSIDLNAGNPGSQYSWSTGDTLQTLTVSGPGDYWVSVDQDGCFGFDTIQVLYHAVPVVNLGNDTLICAGDPLQLDAGNPGDLYLWSTGETTQTIMVSDSGSYSVFVDHSGCTASDTLLVSVLGVRIDLGPDTLLCPGESLALNAGYPGSSYLWSTGEHTQSISVNSTNDYWVQVTLASCRAGDTIHVDVMKPLNLPPRYDLCGKDTVVLSMVNQGSTYLWSTGDTTPSLAVNEPGKYWVRVQRGLCLLSDTAEVVGKPGIQTVYVPNCFTPNEDGLNEVFRAFGEDLTYFELTIFNREGALLFTSYDIQTGWDGKFKGEYVMPGVYIWVIHYKTPCTFDRKLEKAGTVTVLN